jgi:hypothetical protein
MVLLAMAVFCTPCYVNAGCDPEAAFESFEGQISFEGPFSAAEIEERQIRDASERDVDPRNPFGNLQELWDDLKAKSRSSDCFYFFSSDAPSWQELRGRRGYALLRAKEVIGAIVTGIN